MINDDEATGPTAADAATDDPYWPYRRADGWPIWFAEAKCEPCGKLKGGNGPIARIVRRWADAHWLKTGHRVTVRAGLTFGQAGYAAAEYVRRAADR